MLTFQDRLSGVPFAPVRTQKLRKLNEATYLPKTTRAPELEPCDKNLVPGVHLGCGPRSTAMGGSRSKGGEEAKVR